MTDHRTPETESAGLCGTCGLPHKGLTGYNHNFVSRHPTSKEQTETNRDKVLRGEPVAVTAERLKEMQKQAIAAEGIGFMGPLHWHWAAAINELVAARAERDRLRAALEKIADFDCRPDEHVGDMKCWSCYAKDALSAEPSSDETVNDPGIILNELWRACRVVFYPELGDLRGDYPIEHAPGAAKDARDLIEARLAERILQRAKSSQKAGEKPCGE